jgi:hypothetical protein
MHSQGGIEGGMILDWLLQEIPQDLLAKLEVYTFGCASNHFNNPHRHLGSLVCATEAARTRTRMTAQYEGGSIDDKAIKYIEHYANTGDFVARLGVLHFAKTKTNAPTPILGDESITPRFMGRVFENPIPGHQLNQHYLDTMFPLNSSNTAASDNSPFMELPVELGGDQGLELELDNENLSPKVPREDLEQSYRGADVGRCREDYVVVNTNSPTMPATISWGGSKPRPFKVADLSRLWLYRNGRSPPDDGLDVVLNRFATL